MSDARGLGMLTLLLGVLLAASVAIGTTGVTPWDLLDAEAARRALAAMVLWEIRLPRTVLAATTGASLGLSGAVLQGLLRNPLAGPGIVADTPTIAGGFAAVLLLGALAGRGAGTLTLILAGVALSSLAVSLTSLALNLAPSPFAAYEIMFWLLGSVADRSWAHAATALPFVLAGWALLFSTGRGLAALTLGEDVARSLGVDLARLRWTAVIGTAACVGASVAVAGAIGFVGLVAPHLLRRLTGHDPRRLLVPSAVGGAALLLAADLAVRLVPSAQELKLGVATALVGAPVFLWQVLRVRGTG